MVDIDLGDELDKSFELGIEAATAMIKVCRTRKQAIRELDKWVRGR